MHVATPYSCRIEKPTAALRGRAPTGGCWHTEMASGRVTVLSIALLLLVTGALGLRASLDNAEDFERAVFAAPGVSSFLKFYAPWCGHCKALAPAWDQLALEYAASSSVLVGEVDCTSSGGAALCARYSIEGYPTLKFNQAGDSALQDANLPGNSLQELKDFASTKVRPGCSQTNQEACSPEELAVLTSFTAMSAAEREAKLAELDAPLEAAKAVVEKLHEQMEELEEKVEEAEDALEKSAPPRHRAVSLSSLRIMLSPNSPTTRQHSTTAALSTG